MTKCPNCQNSSLRQRGANLIRNVKRREKEGYHDPWVCDHCEWTGTDHEVIDPDKELPRNHNDPLEW